MTSQRFRSSISLMIFLGLLPLAALGCGSGNTVSVHGEVTFDGQPVEEGRIIFRKVDGDRRAFSGVITNGSYDVECEPGRMAVEITASRPIPGKFDYSNGTPEPVGQMYIPTQYNSKTTLSADVSPSQREFPFNLKSR